MIVHASSGGDVVAFVREAQRMLRAELHRDGAVLLRGFAASPAGFHDAVQIIAPRLRRYVGGDSPRRAVGDRIYTSTEYPPALAIPLHNELSYSRDYPALIAFYCEVAPAADGETPLADGRAVLRALPAALVERLRARRLRYVQNLHGGIGLGKSWRDTFETDDATEVEAVLRARGAEFAWRPDGGLRVAETVDAVIRHAPSGDEVLFSQAHLWHVSSLDPKTRAALLQLRREDELYHACSYGDGAPIAEADLDTMRRAFDAASVDVAWQAGDVLLVDNVLVAHGRRPFRGARRILVAMGDA